MGEENDIVQKIIHSISMNTSAQISLQYLLSIFFKRSISINGIAGIIC